MRITIEDFAGAPFFDFDNSGKKTAALIVGENGVGKTSAARGIQYALANYHFLSQSAQYRKALQHKHTDAAYSISITAESCAIALTKSGVQRTMDSHGWSALAAGVTKLSQMRRGDVMEAIARVAMRPSKPQIKKWFGMDDVLASVFMADFETYKRDWVVLAARYAGEMRALKAEWKSLTRETYSELSVVFWERVFIADADKVAKELAARQHAIYFGFDEQCPHCAMDVLIDKDGNLAGFFKGCSIKTAAEYKEERDELLARHKQQTIAIRSRELRKDIVKASILSQATKADKDSLRGKALLASIGTTNDTLQLIAARLGIDAVPVIENDGSIWVKGVPIDWASASEVWLADFLWQVFYCQAEECPLLVADGLDILDATATSQFIDSMHLLADYAAHAVVFATSNGNIMAAWNKIAMASKGKKNVGCWLMHECTSVE